MAFDQVGIKFLSNGVAGARQLSSRVTNSILESRVVRDILPDVFLSSSKQPNKESLVNKIVSKVKAGVKKTDGDDVQASKLDVSSIRKKVTDVVDETVDNVSKKTKKALSEVKSTVARKVSQVVDDVVVVAPRVRSVATHSFENFKKSVDENPVVKFMKSVIAQEEVKVNNKIANLHSSNTVDLARRKLALKQAKETYKKRQEELLQAFKSGSERAISEAKDAFASAKTALNDAKDYFEIALKYFKRSKSMLDDIK